MLSLKVAVLSVCHLVPVGEQQVEVLEGLPEEERLHHVPGPRVQGVPHVADGRVAAGHLRVRLDPLRVVQD